MIAPSGMMDGMVGAIRRGLDDAGFTALADHVLRRQVRQRLLRSVSRRRRKRPSFGDRRTYQMDPANAREALLEAALDLAEGADILMVKPALAYLDIIYRVKETCGLPLAAYNVSGEYAMIKAAAANGWIDERRIVLETLTAIKRAGADMILTYHALDVARWLKAGLVDNDGFRGGAGAQAVRCGHERAPGEKPAGLARAAPGPRLGAVQVVDADLSTITTEADKILRIEEPEPWMVHVEFQSSYDPELPLRIQRYNILAHYRHDLPVQSVVVLLREEADGPRTDWFAPTSAPGWLPLPRVSVQCCQGVGAAGRGDPGRRPRDLAAGTS